MYEVKVSESEQRVEVEINGEIDGLNDAIDAKQRIMQLHEKNPNKKIVLIISNSKSIPSTLLGYLLKLAYENKSIFELHLRSATLHDLLKKMMLLEILNATYIGE